MMKYLHLINAIMVFGACSQMAHQVTLPIETPCFQSAVPEFSSALCDAGIDVVGNHISGLLLVKAMPDSSRRIVFSSETGITFFDFDFVSNYCLP